MFQGSEIFPVPGIYEVSIRNCFGHLHFNGRQVRHVDENGEITLPSGVWAGWHTQTESGTYSDAVFKSILG